MFSMKGIDICVPFGKWRQSGFSIQNGREEQFKEVWIHLLKRDAKFIVHREVTQQKEWEIFLEE